MQKQTIRNTDVWHGAECAADLIIELPSLIKDSPRPLLFRRIRVPSTDGCRLGSRGRRSAEEPMHRVRIKSDYYLGTFATTREQWAAVHQHLPQSADSFLGGHGLAESAGTLPHYPVVHIGWRAAWAFCCFLNESTAFAESPLHKSGYRTCLPTEAEWEYACRGGANQPNPDAEYWNGSGKEALDRVGWHNFNTGDARSSSLTFTPEGTRQVCEPVIANEPEQHPCGLFGMHGNVLEWCFEDWDPNAYRTRPDNDNDPAAIHRTKCLDGENAQRHPLGVARGGSAQSDWRSCTSTYRLDISKTVAEVAELVGFRVCIAHAQD